PWDPEQYRDEYRDDLLATIEDKIASGRTHSLEEATQAPRRKSGKVIDLMSMLQRSIEERGGAAGKPGTQPAKKAATPRKAAKTAAKKRAPARKAPASAKKTGSGGTRRKTA